MTLGDKIRSERLKSGMTQTELAGDHITRNMLSQIENNVAIPSVPTIKYIAKKLKISAGYFLTDTEDEFIYKKMYSIDTIKETYKNKQYKHCIDLCLALKSTDDEIEYILSNLYFDLAYENFVSGNLKTAENLFTTSINHAKNTVYTPDNVLYHAELFIDFIKSINNNLIKTTNRNHPFSPHVETMIYLDLISNLNQKQNVTDNFDKLQLSELHLKHIEAKKLINNSNYTEAEKLLSELLNTDLHPFEKYIVITDMESCYVNLSDFKNAYKYSTIKNELYSQMFNK